ncbi:MAG: transporter substrate-binding domain-containing protein [Bacteroidota bacterium]|nr:transporter substrate-binding domain-containing protein [Bacteroidota bacterium]
MKKIVVLFIAFVLVNSFYSFSNTQKEKQKIIVGVKETPPFIINEEGAYSGISIDIWKDIAKRLKLDFEYKNYNSLSSLLDAVKNNDVDITISPLTVTSGRLTEFDFMQPFYITNLTIAISKGSNSFSKKFFSIGLLKTFVFILIVLVILGIMLWLSERKHYNKFNKGIAGIWHSIIYLLKLKKQDNDAVTKSGGLISILWGFAIIFIISGYGASVFFSLQINKLENDIKSVNDLSEVNVGCISQSSTAEYLISKNIDFKEYATLEKLLEALKKNDIDAVVHDAPILKYYVFKNKLDNDFSILPVTFNKQYYSFAVSHKSPLQYKINPALFNEIECGNMDEILGKYNLLE